MHKSLTPHTPPRNGPLSLAEMVQAVNLIRDFIAQRVEPNWVKQHCSDDGLLNLYHRGSFDILVKAVDTHRVRGFDYNRSYILAKEVGAPSIIQLQIQWGPIHNSTHMDYLLPQRGDDPVVLFINVLRDYFQSSGVQIEKGHYYAQDILKGTMQALLGE